MSETPRPRHSRRLRPWIAAGLTLVVVAACGSSQPSPPPVAEAPVAVPSVSPSVAPSPTPLPSATPTPTPTPTPDPLAGISDLTGLPVDPAIAHRLPLAVSIDDSRQARPQSGFNGASIVYQSLADGFESRYLMIFSDGDSTSVGPVRSARFFLIQWASEVDAALAHYGGDRRSRNYIVAHPVPFTSVDGLSSRGHPAFHRIKSRKAPHNAYTNTKKLRAVALHYGAPPLLDGSYHRRSFMDASPVDARGTSQSIRIPYHTSVITYKFDQATDRYERFVNGKKQIDPAAKQQVAVENVIVLFQKFRIDTKIEKGHSRPDITTLGKGKALVFREGRVVEGTWSKASANAPTIISDAAGVEIPWVRGHTFIQSVPPSTKVKVGD